MKRKRNIQYNECNMEIPELYWLLQNFGCFLSIVVDNISYMCISYAKYKCFKFKYKIGKQTD